jgi:hypothetical protein
MSLSKRATLALLWRSLRSCADNEIPVAGMLHFCNVVDAGAFMRDKRGRFVELAEARVSRATQTLRLIGNLSNLNNYAFSEADAQKILATLDSEMKLLKAKFQTALRKRQSDEFKLE